MPKSEEGPPPTRTWMCTTAGPISFTSCTNEGPGAATTGSRSDDAGGGEGARGALGPDGASAGVAATGLAGALGGSRRRESWNPPTTPRAASARYVTSQALLIIISNPLPSAPYSPRPPAEEAREAARGWP